MPTSKLSWVSINDASKEVTMPEAPPSLIQVLDRAFAQRTPYSGGWSSKVTPLAGRMMHEGAAAITVSKTGGKGFRLEHPNPSHYARPAYNAPGNQAMVDH